MRLETASRPSCRLAGCERPVSLLQARHSLALPPRRFVPGTMDRTNSRRVDAEPSRTEAASRIERPPPAACHAQAICGGTGHRVRAIDRGARASRCRRPPVLAAAIRCGAQYVVTDNLADFPAEVLAKFYIEAIDADEFLSRTFDLYPSEALGVLRTLREAYSNPPFTPADFVRDLAAKGLTRLAAQTRVRRDAPRGSAQTRR